MPSFLSIKDIVECMQDSAAQYPIKPGLVLSLNCKPPSFATTEKPVLSTPCAIPTLCISTLFGDKNVYYCQFTVKQKLPDPTATVRFSFCHKILLKIFAQVKSQLNNSKIQRINSQILRVVILHGRQCQIAQHKEQRKK